MDEPKKRGGARPGAGRKRKTEEEEIKRAFLQGWPESDRIQTIEVMGHRARAGDVKAATLLMNYAYGRPIERQVISGESGEAIRIEVAYADLDPAEAAPGAEEDNP